MTFGSGYDAWLEAPYVERARQDAFAEDAVEAYVEHFGCDEEDVDTEVAVEWWESRMQDAHEDYLIDKAERERDEPDFDDDRW